MNEKEFSQMVSSVRDAEKSIGKISYELTDKQLKGRNFSRSLYIVEDIKSGDILNKNNLKSIRPGFGLHPKYFNELIGKKVNQNISRGTRMSLSFIN